MIDYHNDYPPDPPEPMTQRPLSQGRRFSSSCGEITAIRFLNAEGLCDRLECLADRGLVEIHDPQGFIVVANNGNVWSADGWTSTHRATRLATTVETLALFAPRSRPRLRPGLYTRIIPRPTPFDNSSPHSPSSSVSRRESSRRMSFSR